MKASVLPLLTAGLLAFLGHDANAGLIGDSITLHYSLTGASTTTDSFTAVSGANITCTGGGAGFFAAGTGGVGTPNVCSMLTAANATQTILFGDDTVSYSFAGTPANFSTVSINQFDFQGLDLGNPITGASVVVAGMSGPTNGDLVTGSSSLIIKMSGVAVLESPAGFTVTLETIPEPWPLATLAFAVGVITLTGRRSFLQTN